MGYSPHHQVKGLKFPGTRSLVLLFPPIGCIPLGKYNTNPRAVDIKDGFSLARHHQGIAGTGLVLDIPETISRSF